MTLKLSSHLLPKFSRVPFTIVLIPLISTIVNVTLLNFDKRYKDNLRVILVTKVALRFGCVKQSKNLEWCLMHSTLDFCPISARKETNVPLHNF